MHALETLKKWGRKIKEQWSEMEERTRKDMVLSTVSEYKRSLEEALSLPAVKRLDTLASKMNVPTIRRGLSAATGRYYFQRITGIKGFEDVRAVEVSYNYFLFPDGQELYILGIEDRLEGIRVLSQKDLEQMKQEIITKRRRE